MEKGIGNDECSYGFCKGIVESWIDDFDSDDNLKTLLKGKCNSNNTYYNIMTEVEVGTNSKYIVEFVDINVQHGGELCGFHALYNLVQFSSLLTSSDEEEKFKYGQMLTKPVK